LEDQNYRAYLARAEEARLSNAMDAEKLASVKVIERAKAPLHPLNAKLGLKMLMAVLFGLIGGLGLAFVREMWSDRFETVDDVESYLGLPVLASVPKFRLKM
jgi:capsular polysaccharide biosynthesis protein